MKAPGTAKMMTCNQNESTGQFAEEGMRLVLQVGMEAPGAARTMACHKAEIALLLGFLMHGDQALGPIHTGIATMMTFNPIHILTQKSLVLCETQKKNMP